MNGKFERAVQEFCYVVGMLLGYLSMVVMALAVVGVLMLVFGG